MLLNWEKRWRTSLLSPSIIALIIVGLILRFSHLAWGSPYFFHPDERNIASAITRLEIPTNYNPEFFAYGGFPIYLNFFLQFILSLFGIIIGVDPFSSAVYIGRFLSAFSSVASIPLTFLVGKRLFNTRVGFLAMLLVTFNAGLIQYAHFGTFESILALLYLLLVFASHQVIIKNSLISWISLGFIAGLSIGTKVTSLLVLGVYPYLFFLLLYGGQVKNRWQRIIFPMIVSVVLAGLIFIVTNPYVLLDFSSFQTSVLAESSIASGSIPAFYTRQFIDTLPVIFHFSSIFPWILGWGLTLVLPFAILYGIWTFKLGDQNFKLLFVAVIPHLIFDFFLFAKWTRYIVPLLPLIIILVTAFLIHALQSRNQFKHLLITSVLFGVIVTTLISGLSMYSVYRRPDTRIEAAAWTQEYIPTSALILTESNDLGILPFSRDSVTAFNFYDLDTPSQKATAVQQLIVQLERSDYVLILSRRVWRSVLAHPERFPITSRFYSTLLDRSLGYSLVQTFSAYPNLLGWEFPDNEAEETFRVFDHPTLYLFHKDEVNSADFYYSMLNGDI